MPEPTTIQVHHPDHPGQTMLINEEDFDPAQHQVYSPASEAVVLASVSEIRVTVPAPEPVPETVSAPAVKAAAKKPAAKSTTTKKTAAKPAAKPATAPPVTDGN